MIRVEVKSKGSASADGDIVRFEGSDVSIQKATEARTESTGRWAGRPEDHRFTVMRQRLHGEGEHWLFRVAMASLAWNNQGANPPEATFGVSRIGADGNEESVLSIQTRGMVVSDWSMSWSSAHQSIIENLSLCAWQMTNMTSDLHKEAVTALLADVGPAR